MTFCLDTYALVEIHKGNPKFEKLQYESLMIPDLILAEFHGILYSRYNRKTADYWMRRLMSHAQNVPFPVLLAAMRFKVDQRKRNLSFFDCVGYLFARENKMRFVTGDKEFKDLPGVLFLR